MVTEVLQIGDDDDDEIEIIYSTPVASKSGAISVEEYRRKGKTSIDLTLIDGVGVVEIPASFFTKRRRLYRGESSNSKHRADDDDDDVIITRHSFTCQICADEKPHGESFRILGCHHSYCTICVSSYVAAKLQSGAVSAIGCPVPGCEGHLEPQHCRTILPREVFDRWGDVLCEALVLGEERFYCPHKDCSALLIHDGPAVVQSECPECRRLFCVPCKAPWHAGVDCAEYQRLSADERSNEDLKLLNMAKENKWVRCRKCRMYVSKNGGCNYVYCRCGYMFCYECGAQICICYKKRSYLNRFGWL